MHYDLTLPADYDRSVPDGPGDRYQVLLTSSPHLHDLKPGRQW
jgi:hypothetical protein